jgi:carboxyl-terminal processing protease
MEPEKQDLKYQDNIKNNGKKFGLILAVIAVFATGWLVGSGKVSLNTGEQLASIVADGKPADLSVDGLEEIYDQLKRNYDGDIDQTKLLDGLKKGAVAAVGDTYTEYLSAEEAESFNSELNGTFEGIGAELSKENSYIVIIAPIKGTPAEKAGLQPQDIITKINGEDATNITVYEAVQKIRGEKGTTVTLNIIRGSEQVEVSITRDRIDVPSVEWRIEDGIGIIEIGRFSDDTTQLTEKAAREFAKSNIKKVILDLRGNPGGLLDQAVGVANVWLPQGSTVLEEKRGGETIQTFDAPKSPILNGVKTIVLINEGSASASEIVAGALKDNKVASLMGEKSYGKGSVQQVIELSGGGALKVTIARWFTPAGKNIDKEGIEPDTKVERTPEDIKAKRDPQLDSAKAELSR